MEMLTSHLPCPSSSNKHHHCIATLSGHTSYISSLTLAGQSLFSGSSDGEIRSWNHNQIMHEKDTESAAEIAVTSAAEKGAVKSMIVLADKLFSAHQDHKIRVWKIVRDEDPQTPKLRRIATLPTVTDRTLKLLSPKNRVKNHVDAVSGLALSGDESLVYSVSWDRTLKVWRASDFRCLESIARAHDDAINAVAVSKDGTVFTGSADKTIRVWSRRDGEKKHSLMDTLLDQKHGSGVVNALVVSFDGSVLYSGSSDGLVLVWERPESGDGDGHRMRVVGSLRGHSSAVLCLAIAADSGLVCSGSADQTVRIWRGDGKMYACLGVLEGHHGPVKCLAMEVQPGIGNGALAMSNYLVYSGSLDCDVKVWKLSIPPC